jgi:nickel-dependent lactate racemase
VSERLCIPWGLDDTLELSLPAEWDLMGVFEPARVPPVPDVADAVRRALALPTGSPRLVDLARGAKRVAILVDDLSRPTPAHLMLPPVLDELAAAGIVRSAITIVLALGTHRPMTAGDVARKVGAELSASIAWENHDYASKDKNVYLGRTSRGTAVWVNRTVASADLTVSIGVIEPHVIAGFGGGYKNLIPGVAGAETIAGTHTLNLTPGTYRMTGRSPDVNPMRLDLEEGAALLRRLFFLVNAILDARLQMVHVVAGHPVTAHREGSALSAGMCAVKMPRLADVVIAGSYPMDIDLRQGLKALANTISASRPGGVVIDLVRAIEGTGHMAVNGGSPLGHRGLKLLAPLLVQAVARKRSSGQGEEFRFFQYFGLQALRRNHLLVYAPTVPRHVARRMPLAEFAWTLEEVWRKGRRYCSRGARVAVFPAGGVTYPVLDSESE